MIAQKKHICSDLYVRYTFLEVSTFDIARLDLIFHILQMIACVL